MADGTHELARVAALRQLQILDTGPEETYDDLCLVAATALRAPIAMITLVDERRQWFKARYGLEPKETARDIAFCHYTIQGAVPFVVADSWEDPRFCGNPLVIGPPNIRFYAGVPLTLPEGMTPGSLAVIDTVPRQLDEAGAECLKALGRLAVHHLVARRAAAQL